MKLHSETTRSQVTLSYNTAAKGFQGWKRTRVQSQGHRLLLIYNANVIEVAVETITETTMHTIHNEISTLNCALHVAIYSYRKLREAANIKHRLISTLPRNLWRFNVSQERSISPGIKLTARWNSIHEDLIDRSHNYPNETGTRKQRDIARYHANYKNYGTWKAPFHTVRHHRVSSSLNSSQNMPQNYRFVLTHYGLCSNHTA